MPKADRDSLLRGYAAHLNWWLRLQSDVVRHTAAALLIKVAKSPLASGTMGDLVPSNFSYLIAAGVVVWKPNDHDRRHIELPDPIYCATLARCGLNGEGMLVLKPERPQPQPRWVL